MPPTRPPARPAAPHPCLDPEELAALLDSGLRAEPLSPALLHLWSCPACRRLAHEVAICCDELEREEISRLPVC